MTLVWQIAFVLALFGVPAVAVSTLPTVTRRGPVGAAVFVGVALVAVLLTADTQSVVAWLGVGR